MFEIISKKEAIAKGLDRYFTGKLCKRNHRSYRYVKGGGCIACLCKSIVTSSPKRLLEGEIVTSEDPRIEMINRRLAIQEREIALKEKALQIRAQNALSKTQLTIAQAERKEIRERKLFVKENLVTVNLLGFGEDYHVMVNMVWMAALLRNPMIQKEDVITNRMKNEHYVMRCFPEDKEMLCRQTYELYSRRNAMNIDAARSQAIASAQAEEAAAVNEEWPEFRP